MVAVGTFLFFKTLNETLQVKKKKKKEKISSVLEINSPNTFGRRKHPQAYASHLNTAFTPKTANARHPGGKKRAPKQNPNLNVSITVSICLSLDWRVLGVSSCLHVWGLRGLLAYRLCTPIVFYTLLYSEIKASWSPPSWASSNLLSDIHDNHFAASLAPW